MLAFPTALASALENTFICRYPCDPWVKNPNLFLGSPSLSTLKAKSVLEFRRHFGVLGNEIKSSHGVLDPALIEYEK